MAVESDSLPASDTRWPSLEKWAASPHRMSDRLRGATAGASAGFGFAIEARVFRPGAGLWGGSGDGDRGRG
eukprot:4593301-Alexandrium_andersonii.AAC.1